MIWRLIDGRLNGISRNLIAKLNSEYRMTSANPDPRKLLKSLMEENPDATEQELFELLVDAVKDEPDVRDAIIREYVWHVTAH